MNNARILHGLLVLGERMCSAESRSERKMSHGMYFADLHAASDGLSIETSLFFILDCSEAMLHNYYYYYFIFIYIYILYGLDLRETAFVALGLYELS